MGRHFRPAGRASLAGDKPQRYIVSLHLLAVNSWFGKFRVWRGAGEVNWNAYFHI